jgi:hypothetical protein
MKGNGAISRFLLERYAVGEVTAGEKAFVEATARVNAGVAQSIADIQRSNAEVLALYPAERLVPEIIARRERYRARNTRYRPRSKSARALFATAGLAAVLVIALLPALRSRDTRASTPAAAQTMQGRDRMKGAQTGAASSELRVYLKTAAPPDADPLPDKTVVHAGNTVQLAYRVGDAERYGVIFSLDGRGVVTLHYPARVSGSTKLVAGKQMLLDEAYTLDDAPDYEAFFFVTDKAPLDAQAVLAKVEELAKEPQAAPERVVSAFDEIKSVTLVKNGA